MSADYNRIGKVCVVCILLGLAGFLFVVASVCLQDMIVGWKAGRRVWAIFGFFPTSMLWLVSSLMLHQALAVIEESLK